MIFLYFNVDVDVKVDVDGDVDVDVDVVVFIQRLQQSMIVITPRHGNNSWISIVTKLVQTFNFIGIKIFGGYPHSIFCAEHNLAIQIQSLQSLDFGFTFIYISVIYIEIGASFQQ